MTQQIQANRGLFVAFEGVDGAGKSTQIERVAKALGDAGLSVVTTREPTYGRYGKRLRESARAGRLSPQEELDLFLLDRAEHAQTLILPSLQRGQVVLTDRYYFSTLAYQGPRGFDLDTLRAQNEAIAPKPDLLALLTLPIPKALTRIEQQRGAGPDLFESAPQLEACQAIFLAEAERFKPSCVLDAARPPQAITEELLAVIVARTAFLDRLKGGVLLVDGALAGVLASAGGLDSGEVLARRVLDSLGR